jgi:signal transduction histidine kinase
LRNMRQRVEEIGGRCEIQSSPAGTRVSLVYPWADGF